MTGSLSDAARAQIAAADPEASTWLSANAGSGKTRVLTDRVARLLLRGIAPERVLCLTYTKAAAGEMQNRLFARLGGWAMLPDRELTAALIDIGHDTATDPAELAAARRLFARAIEAPGGLKIQTIHSFCAALLRRFPLESGVSPQFSEMDEHAGKRLRADLLDSMADGPDADALAGLALHFTGEDPDRLLSEIIGHQDALSGPPDRAALARAFDLPCGFDTAALLAEAFAGNERALLDNVASAMAQGTVTDQRNAARLRALDLDAPDLAMLQTLEGLLLTGTGAKEPFTAKLGSFPTKATRAALGPAQDALDALMLRVEAARPRRLALAALEKAHALHVFAHAFLPAWSAAKAARGWLDFDDLIRRAGQVLSKPSVAQWVLYKLDGGVDHILVDEAQDTSPGQWRVIESLTQEFMAGEGAQDAQRTLFVVGDRKQSIYSFQGADLRMFEAMRADFRDRLADVGVKLNQMELAHSFRSSDAVLRVVDATFNTGAGLGGTGLGGTGLGGAVSHLAFFDSLPGRVDLWPLIPRADDTPDADWSDPVDLLPEAHHTRLLARRIATEIGRMIDARTPLADSKGNARPVDAGDFLILVRSRGRLFHEIIGACKTRGLDIAGADRLELGAELAVRDIQAVLAFLATPEDDLSLAAALRSPLLGWSEDALFRLARGRKRGEYLWARLRDMGDPATLALLRDLQGQADFLRPYELIERLLTRHDGRRRLIARLGPEAEDGIDALLAQALAYETTEVPSLTGFLSWLDSGEVQVKRQLDSAGQRIRVMTVHGAKGLQAPVVILPDTARRRAPDHAQLFPLAAGQGRDTVGWRMTADTTPPVLEAPLMDAAALRAEEDSRLLYVAMTRAESWLIVAAAGEVGDSACWYDQVERGLHCVGAGAVDFPFGTGLRHAHGDWPAQADAGEAPGAPLPALPDWLDAPVPEGDAAPALLSPSDLGGAKALPGERGAALDEDASLRRGRALHLLLEHMPGWPADRRAMLAADLLTQSEDGLPPDLDDLLAEAQRVIDAPALAFLFAPGARAEVGLTADLGGRRLAGIVDRLIVSADHVLAVDYKSNRVVPARAEGVPEGLLRQMGAYAHALQQIFPERQVETALLWTRRAQLMPLPSRLVGDALERGRLEVGAGVP